MDWADFRYEGIISGKEKQRGASVSTLAFRCVFSAFWPVSRTEVHLWLPPTQDPCHPQWAWSNESNFIFRALFYSTAAAPEAFRRHHHHPDVLACGGIKNRGVSRDTDISMTTKIQKFSG